MNDFCSEPPNVFARAAHGCYAAVCCRQCLSAGFLRRLNPASHLEQHLSPTLHHATAVFMVLVPEPRSVGSTNSSVTLREKKSQRVQFQHRRRSEDDKDATNNHRMILETHQRQNDMVRELEEFSRS